jgi:Fic family protein
MDIKEFNAGVYKQQYQYRSFSPSIVNQSWTWSDAKINTLLEEATHKLGELNAFSLYVPNIDIFIRMHVIKEATTSSRIEGTKTNVAEALQKKEDIRPENKDDWQEVQNYVRAMNAAIDQLKHLPLSTRLLREAHHRLMHGVRGMEKMPGEYRTSQNWIGGATINDAIFIPPHHEEISTLMGDLENFLHNDEIDVPHLIKVAIAHYQFESIHPFLDGNGRIGRLMITLYLVNKELLAKPTLYLSDYFERNKGLYYDSLMLVRTSHNLNHWIKFFLVAVIETSKKGIVTFQKILKLKEKIESEKIVTLGKKVSMARNFVNFLYRAPYVTATDIMKELNVSAPTANALVQDFVSLGILKEITGKKRNRMFFFVEYLRLFSEKE